MPVKLVLESLSIKRQGKVGAAGQQAPWRSEEGGGERKGIAYRAADPRVQLSRQGDVDQRGP
jgi:hypothetical protein